MTFTPSASGARSASISLSDNASDSPQSVALTGSGMISAPAVTLNPTSVSFGNQNVGTTSATHAITLTNSGTAPLTITSVAVSGANASDFGEINTCPISPSTLAANASCTISVTFTPSATGARSANVSISDSAGDSPQSVPLTGTGITPAPGVTLSPTSVSFGNQMVGATSASQTITLTNTGTAPLTISSIALAGTNAADFAESSTCPLTQVPWQPGQTAR